MRAFLAALILCVCAVAPARTRDDGRYAQMDPKLRAWFDHLASCRGDLRRVRAPRFRAGGMVLFIHWRGGAGLSPSFGPRGAGAADSFLVLSGGGRRGRAMGSASPTAACNNTVSTGCVPYETSVRGSHGAPHARPTLAPMTEQKASRSPTSSSIRGRRANSEKRILQKELFNKELSKKNSSKRILKKVRRQKDALIAIG